MATNVNVGSAYLTIIPSTRHFVRHLRKELNKSGFEKIGQNIGEGIEKGLRRSGVVKKIKRSFVDMFSGLTSLGKSGMFDTLIASALAVVSALAPLSGLVLGIPTAAVAAGLAIGALALAIEGLSATFKAAIGGDMENFEKNLEQLTGSARSVARELGGALIGLRDIAQESLFAPMVKSAEGFAAQMQGPVQRSITVVATALGEAGAAVLTWLKSSEGTATLEKSAAAAATTIRELSAGIVPLLQGTLDLASALDVHVGQAIANVATRFGEWMSDIASDGRAQAWFDKAMDAAADLWKMLVNIGRTLAAIFNASGAEGGTLAVLVEATDAMADWAESAKGQETLNEIFQFFGTILKEVVSALGTLIAAFAVVAEWFNNLSPETQSMVAQFMAWTIVIGPIAGRLIAIASLVRGLWGAVVLLGGGLKLAAVASTGFIRGMWGGSAALTAKSGAAMKAGAALRAFIGAIGRTMAKVGAFALKVIVETGKIIGRWALVAAQAVAKAAVTSAAWAVKAARGVSAFVASTAVAAGRVVASWALMAASATKNAAKIAGAWALTALRGTVSAAKQIGAMILMGAKWVWMGVIALVNAAKVALSWLIAMGPVGWVIAILAALVVVFILFWDEIKAAFVAAGEWIWGYVEPYWNRFVEFLSTIWQWIKDVLNWDELVALITDFGTRAKEIWDGFWNLIVEFLSSIWDLIVGLVTGNTEKVQNAIGRLKELPGKFAEWFRGAYNSAKEWLTNAVNYAKEIPGRILSALGDLASRLYNFGKDIIQGLWNGMKDIAGQVMDWVSDTAANIGNSVKDALGIASPSKVTTYLGEMTAEGLIRGMDNRDESISRASDRMVSAVLNPLGAGIAQANNANLRGTVPVDPSAYGTNIENVNLNAADNRFTLSQLEEQVRMRV